MINHRKSNTTERALYTIVSVLLLATLTLPFWAA